MSLHNDIRKKIRLLQADDRLVSQMKSIEAEIMDAISSILRRYSIKGSLAYDGSETKLFSELRQTMSRILDGVQYKDAVQNYLPNFDEVENNALKVFGKVLPFDIGRLPLSVERKFLIEEITSSLLNAQSIKSNVARPVQRILFRNITYGSSLFEAEEQLRKFIMGDKGNGYLSRYVSQIARDTISQYEGLINQKVFEAYEDDLDGFVYAGNLMQTSRENCIELVTGTGRFSDLAIEPAMYRTEDIPEIINRAQNRSGWIPGTNKANFFQNRGGYNCGHTCIPVVLESEGARELSRVA